MLHKNYTILCPNTWHRFIIRKLDEEYNYRKRTSKEIAEASISSLTDIEMSDREDAALQALVEKTKEGGKNIDEQS